MEEPIKTLYQLLDSVASFVHGSQSWRHSNLISIASTIVTLKIAQKRIESIGGLVVLNLSFFCISDVFQCQFTLFEFQFSRVLKAAPGHGQRVRVGRTIA